MTRYKAENLTEGDGTDCIVFACIFFDPGWSQESTDLDKTKELELTVQGQRLLNLERLPPVEGTDWWAKKNDNTNFHKLNESSIERKRCGRYVIRKWPQFNPPPDVDFGLKIVCGYNEVSI